MAASRSISRWRRSGGTWCGVNACSSTTRARATIGSASGDAVAPRTSAKASESARTSDTARSAAARAACVASDASTFAFHHARFAAISSGSSCASSVSRSSAPFTEVDTTWPGLPEPDALVVAAHRVQQQRNERGVEHERQERAEARERRRAEDRELRENLHDGRHDRQAVAPLLLVRGAEAADREPEDDEDRDEHRSRHDSEDQAGRRIDVAKDHAKLQRLGLVRI